MTQKQKPHQQLEREKNVQLSISFDIKQSKRNEYKISENINETNNKFEMINVVLSLVN